MCHFRKTNKKYLSHCILSPNFLLHQNKVWGGGGGECLKGMRILWEEQSCTHCQMILSTVDADM